MKTMQTTVFATLVAAVMSAGCVGDGYGSDFDNLSSEIQEELYQVREATADYHDLQQALDDGFVFSGLPCMPEMGDHYISPSRLGTLDPTEPQVLVYEPSDAGEPLLVALEYVVPIDPDNPQPAPELFGQQFHGPESVEGIPFDFYGLHAWIWRANENGVFADLNPKVSCD